MLAHTKFGLVWMNGRGVKRGGGGGRNPTSARSERVFEISVQIGLKVLLFVFTHQAVFSFVCCSIFQERPQETLRNFEYSKSHKAMKLMALRPELSLL